MFDQKLTNRQHNLPHDIKTKNLIKNKIKTIKLLRKTV